ncbi:MAG: hypothetical protein ACRCVI_03165 [Mycoplasmoidaceae bacterium]
MINIRFNNINYEFEFNNLKIIDFEYPSLFIKNMLCEDSVIMIDERSYHKKIIHINEMTKIKDLITLQKNGFIFENITNNLNEFPIINIENVNKICEKINEWAQMTILENNDGDINKIINLLFELKNNDYLNEEWLIFILENSNMDEDLLFLIEDVSWFDFKKIKKYINNFKFIVVTNDFRKYLSSDPNDFELVTMIKQNWDYSDMLDFNKIKNFIELNTNDEFNDEKYQNFYKNRYDSSSLNILNLIKNI